MSIVSEIERIKTNIANAYTACQGKGATLPTVLNSANLAECIASITGGEPITPQGYVTDGIFANYSGYDCEGGTAWVDSVNSKNITMYNNPVFDTDNHCWIFDGVNQYGFADNVQGPVGDVTVELYGSVPEINSTNAGVLALVGSSWGWYEGYGCMIRCDDTGNKFEANVNDTYRNGGFGLFIEPSTIVGANVKTKVVVRRTKSTGLVQLYAKNVNGVESNEGTTTTKNIVNRDTRLIVGAMSARVGYETAVFRKGSLYAVRVYNRVLTDEEIAQNHAEDVHLYGE